MSEMPQQTSKSMTNYSDKSIPQIEISLKLINQQSNEDKLLYEMLKWQWELITKRINRLVTESAETTESKVVI